ncbi:MAG: terminase small subunit [Lachnospiraceae bacterium]|nr:terminase small subunit [Lachnospiraceae bacterium]
MLTDRQRRFVGEYLIDLNATQAAIRAGYSRRNADKIGSELLGKTSVSRAVRRAMEARAQRTEIEQDRVIRELAAVAFSDVSDYARVVEKQAVHTAADGMQIPLFDSRGEPVIIQDVELVLTDRLTPDQKRAISRIRKGKYGVEVTLCDKMRALELLGRHLGMFSDRVEVPGLNVEMSKMDALILEMGIKVAAVKQ